MTRWIAALMISILTFALSTAVAQQPNAVVAVPPPSGPHGGQIHQVGDFQGETVFSSKSVEVYVFDRAGEPVSTRNSRGRATFNLQGDPRKYRYDLYPRTGNGAPVNGFHLAIDLSRVADRAAVVEFALYGIAEQPIAFATQVQRSLTAEQIAIRSQRICPVSGKPLGSMGAPPKVRIGDQEIYVCCAGCTSALKSDPKLHLAKLVTMTAVKATKEDAASIASQRICPVMDEPLEAMGGPWKVTVQGRPVFVCCKGCIKKVQERPDKYLNKVAALRKNDSLLQR